MQRDKMLIPPFRLFITASGDHRVHAPYLCPPQLGWRWGGVGQRSPFTLSYPVIAPKNGGLGRGNHPTPQAAAFHPPPPPAELYRLTAIIFSQQQQKTPPKNTFKGGNHPKELLTKPPDLHYTCGRSVAMVQEIMFDPGVRLVGEAAKELGVSRWTVYRRVRLGMLRGIRLGGVLFIPLSEIDRYHRHHPARPPGRS